MKIFEGLKLIFIIMTAFALAIVFSYFILKVIFALLGRILLTKTKE